MRTIVGCYIIGALITSVFWICNIFAGGAILNGNWGLYYFGMWTLSLGTIFLTVEFITSPFFIAFMLGGGVVLLLRLL